MLSSWSAKCMTSNAGDLIYSKDQMFVYDNKRYINDSYFFSTSSCTTSLSSLTNTSDNETYRYRIGLSYHKASFVSVSASQNITGTVYVNYNKVLDNSTLFFDL